MKKILFATTALVATASVAAADVTFSGMGRFGVKTTSTTGAATVTDITTRMQLDVKASVELESGITLGAATRWQDTDGAASKTFNAPTFTMSTGGLTLVVGNNYGQMYRGGAGGYAVGLTGLGFEGDAFTGFDEYSSNGTGPQGADVNYTMGNLSMGVSHSKGTKSTQAAVSYTAGSVTLAAGLQDGKLKADDYSVVSVDYEFGNGSVGLKYGDNNGTKTTVLGGSFDIGAATSLTAFVKDTNTATVKNVYGIGVSHDLGGAKLQAGYVDNATGSVADFGITFNF